MTNFRMTRLVRTCVLAVAALFVATSAFASATIVIVNNNAANIGFNDPTPAAPVGGNPGTTIGQQRLIAMQFAADIWAATLDSNVPIVVDAAFVAQGCNATSATLGSAGTVFILRNFNSSTVPPSSLPTFPGAVGPNLWHGSALADKRAGLDVLTVLGSPGQPDIRARFNVNLGLPGCLTGIGFYYGLDNNAGTQIDFISVALHELGHGMGFQQFANLGTGVMQGGSPDVYNRNLLDLTQNKTWDVMTNAERVASAINSRKVVWTGAAVTAAAPSVLNPGTPLLRVNSPGSVAGVYAVGTATFGAPLSSPGVSGDLALGQDAVGTIGDGCEPLVSAVAGKIAVIDRGICGFVVKAKNAQDAGAIGMIIVDNVAGSPPIGMSGVDPTVVIPSVRVSLADGNALKAAMLSGTVNVTLTLDPAVLAGADPGGRLLVNAPNPVSGGSSISHWDPIADPNLVMEPNNNPGVPHALAPPSDLTLPLMRDIGWFPDPDLDGFASDVDCEPESDLEATINIAGCETGVPNTFFTTGPNAGCSISDLIAHCEDGNHGGYVSCVAHLLNDLRNAGIITAAQKGAIQRCAAKSRGTMPVSSNIAGSGEVALDFAGAHPSRGSVDLKMTLPRSAPVMLGIYDVRGAQVWAMTGDFSAGEHDLHWNGMTARGGRAPAGVYFAHLSVPGQSAKLRLVLIP